MGGSSNDLEAAVAETEAVFGDWDAICIQEIAKGSSPLTQNVLLAGHAYFACHTEKGRSVGTIIHNRWKNSLRFARPHQPIPNKQQPAASSEKPAASSQQPEAGSKIAPKRPQDDPR